MKAFKGFARAFQGFHVLWRSHTRHLKLSQGLGLRGLGYRIEALSFKASQGLMALSRAVASS